MEEHGSALTSLTVGGATTNDDCNSRHSRLDERDFY